MIDYDRRLNDRARELRKNMTPAEKKIWYEVFSSRQFHGYRFLRQKPLLHFIVDFYCSELLLVIEIDGSSHDDKIEYDEERTVLLEAQGLKVLRYLNEDILGNLEGVKGDLEKHVPLFQVD